MSFSEFEENIRRAIVSRRENNVNTPQLMIYMDNLLESTIGGITDKNSDDNVISFDMCAELYGWQDDQRVISKSDTGGQFLSTAKVQDSGIILAMHMGIHLTKLETKLYKQEDIERIHIFRLANITDLKVPLQTVTLENSKVVKVKQTTIENTDLIFVLVNPRIRNNIIYKYAQDGLFEGQDVSKFNYTTGDGLSDEGPA